jgi:hypothetical protein
MPKYEFECDEGCVQVVTCLLSEFDWWMENVKKEGCIFHHKPLKRKYRPFGFTMPLADGFSPATGTYVSGNRNLREQFKIASAQATERTGIPHNFQPVDMRDTETLGITEEGLADDNRTRHDRGEPVVTAPGLDV